MLSPALASSLVFPAATVCVPLHLALFASPPYDETDSTVSTACTEWSVTETAFNSHVHKCLI
jgi:hypothetical protein